MQTPPGLQVTVPSLNGARRVTFEEDSLFMEGWDSITGTLRPEEEIFWEEVREVYVWTRPDWQALIIGLVLVWFPILLTWSIFSMVLSGVAAAMTWLVGVLALAFLVFYVVRVMPRNYVRVVSDVREILFSTAERHYVRALMVRLGIPVPAHYRSKESRSGKVKGGPENRA